MKIALSGYGAMGKVLERLINEDENLELVGIVDFVHGPLKSFDALGDFDVLIDFSHFSVLNILLDFVCDKKKPVLIATTNLSNEQLDKIKLVSQKVPVLQTGNTSLGINVLVNIVNKMTSMLQEADIEVLEAHHNKKEDAPSGTAKMLVNAITDVRSDANVLYERTTKRNKNDVTVQTLRMGNVRGEHSVFFGLGDEVLEVKHTSLSKDVFASGALKAAKFLCCKTSGLYSMEDVLF